MVATTPPVFVRAIPPTPSGRWEANTHTLRTEGGSTAANAAIERQAKRARVVAPLAFLLSAVLFSTITVAAEEDKGDEYPGLGKPVILFVANGDDWTRGSIRSLAITRDSSSIVASLRRLPGSRSLFLLQQRVGEVCSVELATDKRGSETITTARNEWFEILTTPSGVCREPLLLARSQSVRPDEVAVFHVGNNKEESLVQKFPIPRADKVTIHTANSICVAVTPASETFILGTSRMEWQGVGTSATVDWWGDVRAWDLKTGEVHFADPWEGNQVLDIACSVDGKLIAAGGGHSTRTVFGGDRYEGRVVCWDESFQKKPFDLALPNHQVHCLVFSPDSKSLVTGGLDGVVKWIDVTQGKVVTSLDVASCSGKTLGRVESLAFSPDGNLLAAGVGSWNRGNKWGEMFLIDVPKVEVYKVPSSQEDHVITCVAFSPDGKYLAAGGMEGILKLWQIDVEGEKR